MKRHAAIAITLVCAAACFGAPAQFEKIDKNFAVEKVKGLDVVYADALKPPFELEGFPWREEGKRLRRIPHGVKISAGVDYLANHTAGGVIRFRTNSPRAAIRAWLLKPEVWAGHFSVTGMSGLDFFMGGYSKNINPYLSGGKLANPAEALMANIPNPSGEMRDCELYLPLYNGIEKIEIGLAPGAKIEPPKPRKIKKPILFYGSSITQGACACRPSNAYAAMLCRAVDAPMINLGFSGSAKGEEEMARLIASLDISVFVYDYDHNAPNPEHLANTHEKFFKIIRKAKPDLPVIMLSKITSFAQNADLRRAHIKRTYDNAVAAGDEKVWLIDGRSFVKGVDPAHWTVDNVHPNDYGFWLMYRGVLPVLERALQR